MSAILFDLDGTLADTAPDLLYAMNMVCAEMQRQPIGLEQMRPFVSLGSPKLIELALGISVDDANYPLVRERFLAHYAANIARHTTLMPDMSELLAHLDAANMPWGIVTNKSTVLTTPLIAALQLDARAVCVVSGDTAGKAKPDAAPLLHACASIGCDPQLCVYVGDAHTDVIAAQRAGMRAVAVSYGYIPTTEKACDWGADATVQSVNELTHWLRVNRYI